jgi:hypothetical protein
MNAKVFCFVTLSLVIGNPCRSSENWVIATPPDLPPSAVPAAPIPGLETRAPNLEKPQGSPVPDLDDEARAQINAREAIWRKQASLWTNLFKKFRDLFKKFRDLQSKRAAMLVASDKIRAPHIKALRELYDQAVALGKEAQNGGGSRDTGREITINTELNIFGARVPHVFCWIVNDDQRVEPKMLMDPRTHITYKLDSDGRHVTATAPSGKVLWAHDAFNDYGLEPYRVTKPVIMVFKLSAGSQEEVDASREHVPPSAVAYDEQVFRQRQDYSKRFIEVTFNSSQFGDIDAATGKFTFLGQN